jgi:hypothetical protein
MQWQSVHQLLFGNLADRALVVQRTDLRLGRSDGLREGLRSAESSGIQ